MNGNTSKTSSGVFFALVDDSYYPNDKTSTYQGNSVSFKFNILMLSKREVLKANCLKRLIMFVLLFLTLSD